MRSRHDDRGSDPFKLQFQDVVRHGQGKWIKEMRAHVVGRIHTNAPRGSRLDGKAMPVI